MSGETPSGKTRLVSVIVPAFNHGHFLPATLASVAAQTYADWECIVVDDGSTDDTREVAERTVSRDSRFHYLHQHNQALSAARNAGLRAARGQYVQLLDADDLLEPRKLERHVAYLSSHPEVGIVYGDVRYFPSDRPAERRYSRFEPDREWMSRVSGSGREVLKVLIRDNIMVCNAPLLRRAVIERVGPFDPSLHGLEDWQYWIRCAASSTTFQYLDEPDALALVRIHKASMSQDRGKMLKQKLRLRETIQSAIPFPEIAEQNRALVGEDYGAIGLEMLRRGERLAGVRDLWRASLDSPRLWLRAWWLGIAALAPLVPTGVLVGLGEVSLRRAVRERLQKTRARLWRN